jgi:hypothetical protein
MLVGELDRASASSAEPTSQIAVAPDDRLDESTREAVVVGDDQTEGHLRTFCTPFV